MVTPFFEEDLGEALESNATPVVELDRRRDRARFLLIAIFGVAFLLTVAWALGSATFADETGWANTKDALLIVLPVESSLLGAAVAFYFTSGEQR